MAAGALAAFLLLAGAASADGTVDVTVNGGGAGTVTSTSQETNGLGTSLPSPGEIDCATAAAPPHDVCSATFDFNFLGFLHDGFVTLTAAADAGSYFAGWAQTGASSSQRCTTPAGEDATCRVDLNGTPGPAATVTATFAPIPDAPVVTTDPPTAEGDSTATMQGRVNPGGAAVSKCHFEYGTTADYGAIVPCDPAAAALGSGTADVAVGAETPPLESGTTYHYRLVAANLGGSSAGADQTFTTTGSPACANADIRHQQGIEAIRLPDCMAYEMVSPPEKGSQSALLRDDIPLSPALSNDGGRLLFVSRATMGGSSALSNPFGDAYVGTRGETGWTISATATPAHLFARNVTKIYSPDLGRWAEFAATTEEYETGRFRLLEGGVGSGLQPRSQLFSPIDAFHGVSNVEVVALGVSSDLSHVFFRPGDIGTAYLAGDPSPGGSGVTARANTYVSTDTGAGLDDLALMARDEVGGDAGKVWGGRCGAWVGGGNLPNDKSGGRTQGAVSPDGSRVLMTTRPAQPDGAACDSANQLRILERVETASGPDIAPVTPLAPATGSDYFQGASADGERVFFTTPRALAPTDVDASATDCLPAFALSGCDLYMYDATLPEGERYVQVSAGGAGDPSPGAGAKTYRDVTAISGDGSRAYFVAQGVLTTTPNPQGAVAVEGQRNLYMYQRDAAFPDGRTVFVGSVAASGGDATSLYGRELSFNNGAAAVPLVDRDAQGDDAGGAGTTLFFYSSASLTADDGDGGKVDLFRYDSEEHELARISKAIAGGSDNGAIDVDRFVRLLGPVPLSQFAEEGRWVSEDGRTAVFTTREALTGDGDGLRSPYLWRLGDDGEPRLTRLPGSQPDGPVIPSLAIVSGDGSSVVFETADRLLAQDGDTARDVYVARVGGGHPLPPAPPAACDSLGDGCQGAGAGRVAHQSQTSDPSAGDLPRRARKLLAVSLSPRARRRASRTGRILLAVRSNRPGRVRAVATARVGRRVAVVGRGAVRLRRAGRARVTVRLSRVARRRLSGGRALRLRLRVASPGARARTLTVRLPGAAR